MNRQIRQLAAGLIVCYVALFVALNFWQVGRKEELDSRFDNTRAVLREFNKPRGPIVTADGVVVARSVTNPLGSTYEFSRDYPAADLMSNVTGYYTLSFGSTQVEREYGDVLTGTSAAQQVRSLGDLLGGDVDSSGSVQLTLRHDAQNSARFFLGGREGSVVVVKVETGAVVAMWSNPSYDPNTFVNEDFDIASDVIRDLQEADGNPLLANAYQERYMPGSTFKMITTGIGLEDGSLTLASQFDRVREWVPPQTNDPIQNYRGSQCGGDLAEVFRRSCNIPFAQTAVTLGPDAMVAGTRDWGLEEELPIDLPRAAASTFGNTTDLDQNLPLLAIRGFGQNEDQMVPLHMALVGGAIANGGQMMKPYTVAATFDHEGRELDRTQPEVWKTPLSPQNASIIADLMVMVAESGTASCCIGLEGGVPVAAKTGTADLGLGGGVDQVHAWIVAFAPADDPKYVVAVVLTNLESTPAEAATGGRLAGPVAKGVLDFLLTGDGAG